MTTLNQRIAALATAIGTDIKGIYNLIGVLSTLSTTDKTSVVAAINELNTEIGDINSLIGGTSAQLAAAVGASGTKTVKEALLAVYNLITTEASDRSSADQGLQDQIDDINDMIAGGLGAQIDDLNASTSTVYSSSKVDALISNLEQTLLGGIPDSTLDTIKEIADFLKDNSVANGLIAQLSKRVRVDAAQTFTGTEQAQGRSNIGAASATDLSDLISAIGTIDYNYVADYNTAKA